MTALAIGSGLALGAMHGVGPDHCAAIATLLARGDARAGRAVGISLRFGLGHVAALTVLALGATMAGVLIPPSFETAMEVAGGAVLIALGLLTLVRPGRDLVLHRHAHEHEGEAHRHWHVHVGDEAPHRHRHLSTLVGGALGASGARALAIALPPLLLAAHSFAAGAAFVIAFGVGVTISMIAVALGLAWMRGLARRSAHFEAWPDRLVAGGTIALGVYWVAANLL